MTTRQHFNNSDFLLAADLSDVATSITLNNSIPTITAGEVRYTIYSGSNVEIISIASNAGAPTYTCTRALEGTTAIAWSSGTAIQCRATADSLDRKADTTDLTTGLATKQATLSGAAISTVTIAGSDLMLFQDASDSNNLKRGLVTDISSLSVFVYLDAKTASASSELVFTGLANYTEIVFKFVDVVAATDAVGFYAQTSTNNGLSYDSGAADYSCVVRGDTSGGSSALAGSTSDTKITIIPNGASYSLGNATGEAVVGDFTITNPTGTAKRYGMLRVGYLQNQGFMGSSYGSWVRNSAADIDAIRFYMSSGNITSGTIYCYGIKKS